MVIVAPENGLNYIFMESEDCQEEKVQEANYLVLELETGEEHSLTFNVDFYREVDKKEYDLRVTFSILPGMPLTVPIDLGILSSKELIIRRTKGRLRMMVYGKPLSLKEVKQIRFSTLKCYKKQEIDIKQVYFSRDFPEIGLPDEKMVDIFGQWKKKAYSGKQEKEEDYRKSITNVLQQFKEKERGFHQNTWNSYGGYKKLNFGSTGWFRVVRDNSRYWLADPEGNAFFSVGVDCINPGSSTRTDLMEKLFEWLPEGEKEYEECIEMNGKSVNFGIANLIRGFGKDNWRDKWTELMKGYLYKWGYNTVGNWTEIEFIRKSGLPYVIPLDVYSAKGFPSTKTCIFRDFPDVFAVEYEENSSEYAKAVLTFRDDPLLIGYFMRNEPEWGFVYDLNIAEEMLKSPIFYESKREFICWMKAKYKDASQLYIAWKRDYQSFDELAVPLLDGDLLTEEARKDLRDFSAVMINRYVEIPAREVKKLDSNHLNLGMRYAFITDPVMLSGYENFDVFSINCYQMNPYKQVETLGKLMDKPIMIGEFHFGSLDSGLTATGLRGVTDQTERGIAYQYYLEQGINSKYFVGAHYFCCYDESCTGRSDGENYGIGMLDAASLEYEDMTGLVSRCNYDIYEICTGRKASSVRKAREIPAIHC